MSAARPADFEPLAPADPVPGDAEAVAALGRRYRDTASEIARQAASLRKLATQAAGGWQGQAGAVFHSHAADLASRISQAQARYAAAGDALLGWAGPLADAQERVYAAVRQAKSAQQQAAANAPVPAPPAGSPPPTAAQHRQELARRDAYDEAQGALGQARRQFEQAVGDYHRSAARAAGQIEQVIGHDGLKDSWWDRNFGWISRVMHIIGIVVILIGIVALLLACPLTAAGIAAILGFVSLDVSVAALAGTAAVLGWVVFGAMAAQTAFDSAAAETGKGSWTAVAFDVAALATFGFGKAVALVGRGLASGALDAGEAVAAGRAGRAAMSARGWPVMLYSIGSRSSMARWPMGLVPKLGGSLDESVQAAADARTAVATAVRTAEPGNLATLWNMNRSVAESLARLSALDQEVPGVLRITVPQAAARGLSAIDGTVKWTMYVTANVHGITSSIHNHPEAAAAQAGIGQAIGTFRGSLCLVP